VTHFSDLARDAARGLVKAGDETVAALLDADAKAASALTRARAAVWYMSLGRVDRAVGMLGDADARVRAAGAILEMDGSTGRAGSAPGSTTRFAGSGSAGAATALQAAGAAHVGHTVQIGACVRGIGDEAHY
jgi:hypothetical protein